MENTLTHGMVHDQPAPKPFDPITELINHMSRYMAFPNDDQPLVLALWILHTHTFRPDFPRAPWVTPYIYINSSGPACGKTLLLDVMEPLVRQCKKSGDMSSAAMFRIIEKLKPTIMIDEVDTIWNGAKNDDLRRTLNTGYKHGGSTDRVSGNTVETYSTFAPKVLAGIRDHISEIPQTVLTRSIPITLKRRPEGVKTEKHYAFKAGPVAEALRELIEAWITVHADAIVDYEPADGDGLEDRAFEISFPLLQIAHAAGCENRARDALARLLSPEPEKEKPEVRTLRVIREVFGDDREKVHTSELLEALGFGEKGGKMLSSHLKPFEISGNNTMSIGDKVAKGYWRHQFEEAWERMGI